MPGSEPWVRVEVGDRVVSMPADVSVLQLWTTVEHVKLAKSNQNGALVVKRKPRSRTFVTRATERSEGGS
jgi:hypothetical protein